jgi:putative tryptophan/tyrosine transport system substrate-binding protein
MRRREFIVLGGAATAWPIAAHAQQTGKLPIVGYLGVTTAAAENRTTSAFVQRLRERGWIEGRTVAIEYRWAEGRGERYTEIAAEFVRLKVDVIVTSGSAVVAAKQATSVIPIVFAVAVDPLGTGLVASLARPGGNVTGLSNQQADLAGKKLELLREVVPGLRRLAILANVGNANAALDMGEAQTAASKLGLEVITSEIRRAEDIAPAFAAFKVGQTHSMSLATQLQFTYRVRINSLASIVGSRNPSAKVGRTPKWQVSCAMDRTSRTCSGAPPTTSTRFCVARSPPTCPSSSRPSSIWSST